MGSITTNKGSGCDGIPVELFQILKDDAMKVLHSIWQQIWKTQQRPSDGKRSVWASLVAQKLKHLPAMQETWARSLGWKDPLEKEMAIHSSILAWRISWVEDPGRLSLHRGHKESDMTEWLHFHFSFFIPIPKKGNAKECSNYHKIALISHNSKVIFKILQARLQQYVNHEPPDVQAGFRKGRGTRDQIVNIQWIIKKAREFQENICFCFIDYAKALNCVDHNKLKILTDVGIPDCLTCLLRNLYAG